MRDRSAMRARSCLLLLPALLAIGPLLARQGQEAPPERADRADRGERDGDGGEPVEGADDLIERAVEPPRPLPAAAKLESNDRERSAPCLVARPGGGAWLVDHEWRGAAGGDFLVAQELEGEGRVVATVELTATAAVRTAPRAALDRAGQLVVVWSEVVDGVAQLRGARVDAAGGATSFALTRGSAPARDPAVARAADGTLWFAWEQWRDGSAEGSGSFDVAAAPWREETSELGPALAVGESSGSDLDPALAAAGGTLFVAWSSWIDRDYEVVVRAIDAAGALGPPLAISAASASDDLHPALAGGDDGTLWIAWDRLVDGRRGASQPADQKGVKRAEQSVAVMVARLKAGAVELVKGRGTWSDGEVPGAPLLGWGGGAPRLALDRAGTPWIAYRYNLQSKSRDRRSGSPLLVQWLARDGWSAAHELADSAGLCDAGALCAASDGVWIAAQGDRRFKMGSLWNAAGLPEPIQAMAAARGDEYATWTGPSAIVVGRLAAGAATTAPDGAEPPSLAWVARAPSRDALHFHPAGEQWRDPFVTGAQRHRVTRGATTWSVFYGDLHRHSSLSRCSRGLEPLPEDRYAFARDVYGDDFLAVTDHAGHLDPSAWARLQRLLALERTPTLVPMAGYECSTRVHGHVNVLFAEPGGPLLAVQAHQEEGALAWLCKKLEGRRALVVPHTSADPGRRVDFSACDPRVTRLLELYQSLRGSFEFDGCWRQSARALAYGSFALDALTALPGVSFIASSDHGNGAAYAGVLAERLDGGDLFAAMEAGRTFAATARGLFVDLRVDDAVMGERVECDAAPTVRLATRMLQPIRDVLVMRDGKPWRRLGRDREPPLADFSLLFDYEPGMVPARADVEITLAVEGGKLSVASGSRPKRGDAAQPSLEVEEGVLRLRWPKGARDAGRDGLRARLRASQDAVVAFEAGMRKESVPLARFREGLSGNVRDARWRLRVHERIDVGVEEQRGLGVAELVQEWRDEELAPGASATYYARVIQADGETAWSSAIRVARR